MQLNTGQWVAIIICAILILGYILGYYFNRRRAEQVYAWLKQGLNTLGEVSIGEKLPGMATGGRLEVNQAAAPLKRVEAVYLLAPRENLLFWIFHILQGRSDELVVWINYQSKPEQSIEIGRKGDRQFEKRLTDKDKPAVSIVGDKGGLQVAVEEKPGTQLASKVQSFIDAHTTSVLRMALRPEKPHLFLRLNLLRMQAASASDLFTALRNLAG
jgi:hypothetical protein